MEKGLQEFRVEHSKAQDEHRTHQATQLSAIEGQVTVIARQFSDQLKASMQLVQDAQLRQQERMQSAMDELKRLIVAQPIPARKARPEEGSGDL